MLRSISALLFLVFFSKFAPGGQNAVIESAMSHKFILKAGVSPGQRNTDYILYTLAIGNARSLSTIKINLGFDTRLQLLEDYGPFTEASLYVDNLQIEGDKLYRQFDISGLLIPDLVQAQLNRYSDAEADPQFFNFSLQQVDWPLPVALIENAWIGDSKPSLHIKQLGYTDEATARFTSMVFEINNYWAAINLIDSLLTEIQVSRVDEGRNPINLFIHWDLIRKAYEITEELAEKYSNTATNGKLKQLHIRLGRMQTRLSTLVDREMGSQIDTVYSAEYFATAFTQRLARQRSTSLRVEFQDAEAFYSSGRLMADETFVDKLRKFDAVYYNSRASQLIYNQLIELGNNFSANDDLAHALDYYVDAQHLGLAMHEIEGNTSLENTIVKTREGLLRAYLTIAARSIEAGNYRLADDYEMKANLFRQLHLEEHEIDLLPIFDDLATAYVNRAEFLIERNNYEAAAGLLSNLHERASDFGLTGFTPGVQQLLNLVHRKVYLSYVSQAERYYHSKNYQQAAAELSQALLYRQRNIVYLLHSNEADELQRQVREPVVRQIIYQGIEAFKHGQHDQALDNFLFARAEVQNYALNLEYPLDSLTSLAAKPILLQHIKSAHLKIWANNFDEAWDIYKDATMLKQTFALNADQDIKRAFDDLDQRFIQRICLTYQLRYLELVDKAERAIRNRTTEMLRPILLEAIQLATDNPGCNIDHSKATGYLQQYSPLFSYRERYSAVMDLMGQERYNEAVSAYLDLETEVVNYQLHLFSVTHTNLINYIQHNSNNKLHQAALLKYLEIGDAENALICLKLLKKGDYRERDSREMQEQTARLVAAYDFAKGLREDPAANALAHVGDHRWFREFRRAYVSSMNYLQQKP
jgi:hypothetical protein